MTAHLRAPIAAIYWFARTADDLADEGDAPAAQRAADLAAYRADLRAAADGRPAAGRWRAVFGPLALAIAEHQLPVALLGDLLSAFEQDIVKTRYASRAELLDYCRRSAHPVGRLLLHLHRVDDAASLRQSDAVCSALQLINFWQDLSVDTARDRLYVPLADAAVHGVALHALLQQQDSAASRALVADLCVWARDLMQQGAPLVHAVPGRAGWELRLVVQGGLRILDKIESLQFATLLQRPCIGKLDAPRLVWRAWQMRASTAAAQAVAES